MDTPRHGALVSRRRPAREARRAGRQSARADRRRVILAHVKAGYTLSDAQRAAAAHARAVLGLVPIADNEPHYLPELGLHPLETR